MGVFSETELSILLAKFSDEPEGEAVSETPDGSDADGSQNVSVPKSENKVLDNTLELSSRDLFDASLVSVSCGSVFSVQHKRMKKNN